MKIRAFVLISLIILAVYLIRKEQSKTEIEISKPELVEKIVEPNLENIVTITDKTPPLKIASIPIQTPPKPMTINNSATSNEKSEFNSRVPPSFIEFNVDPDGWAVAYGDVLLGVPPPGVDIKVGMTKPQPLNLWETSYIPFVIPKDFPNPKRILEAFEFFKNTPIRFVAYEGQPDAIVFESKPGHCRSYLGRIGGLQPILLSNDCQAQEIAHEIMHALGFIHEHSRTDRDNYVEVQWNNIEENFKSQFALVPEPLMEIARKFNFDYQSIMIYPTKAFTKQSSLTTLKSKSENEISPTLGLSKQDIERLYKIYDP